MKSRVTLKRLLETEDYTIGAFSYVHEGEIVTLASLELPWKDNVTNISCIPIGIYKVTTTYSPKFQRKLWKVNNVVGRTGILLHPANFTRELQGCIALGLKVKDIDNDNKLDVTSSIAAFTEAEKVLGTSFELEIIN